MSDGFIGNFPDNTEPNEPTDKPISWVRDIFSPKFQKPADLVKPEELTVPVSPNNDAVGASKVAREIIGLEFPPVAPLNQYAATLSPIDAARQLVEEAYNKIPPLPKDLQ